MAIVVVAVVAAVVVVGRRNGKLSNNVVHNLNRICCVACAAHAPSPYPRT